jgi:hypothetical protein
MKITGTQALQYAKALNEIPRARLPQRAIGRTAELEREIELLKAEIRKLKCLPAGESTS